MSHTPTPEQAAVIDAFRSGHNVTVTAYAGAGKTSTLTLAAATLTGRRGIFTAFNRKIVDDSAPKFRGSAVTCTTTHGLASHVARADGGWRIQRRNAPRMYGAQFAKYLRINDPIRVNDYIILAPGRLASLASVMVERYASSGDEDIKWWHLPQITGVDEQEERKALGLALIPIAKRVWADVTHPNGRLRTTHNHYRKEWALTHPRIDADFIMVDEAQDSAGVVVGVLRDQMKYGAQIITVGDPYQAINGWAGAVDSMSEFGGTELALTQSFRFGPAIADEANKWLTLLGAPAPMRGFDAVQSIVTPDMTPDAILCRTNGSVVEQVITRLAEGQKVAMLGRPDEILNFVRGVEGLQKFGNSDHPDLMAFTSWGQVQDYVEHDEAGADLRVMVKMIDTHGTDGVQAAMNKLTTERYADVTLSTAHKVKGAEWGRVRIADDFRAPKANDDGVLAPSREQLMLAYVAITRAKHALDRGSLSWVDEALSEAATGRTASTPEPFESGTVAIAHDVPAATEQVPSVSWEEVEPRFNARKWVHVYLSDGTVRAVGLTSKGWVTVTGALTAPVVEHHRYLTTAEEHVGLAPAR